MKTNLIKIALASIWIFSANVRGYCQGTFVNLDFESPILPLIPVGFQVPISNALPGWRGYIGGNETDRVVYDTVSLGAAAISFHDAGSMFGVLDGNYSVGLQPSNPDHLISAAIGQTGTVPGGAKSLRFYTDGLISITFAGQPIPIFALGSTSSATIYGGDISAFANQLGELRFQGGGFLDNIQFSNQPIPEPSVFGLFALGALLLCWRFARK